MRFLSQIKMTFIQAMIKFGIFVILYIILVETYFNCFLMSKAMTFGRYKVETEAFVMTS